MKRVNDTWGTSPGIGSLGISPRSYGKPCLPPPNCTATAGTNSFRLARGFAFRCEKVPAKVGTTYRALQRGKRNTSECRLGHAFFNPETDHGLSEIVKRADGMLYAMKRAMKQAAENAS